MALTDATTEIELTLGQRLAHARESRTALRQKDIAGLLGVHFTTVSRWERDLAEPGVSQAKEWARITGVSFGALCGVKTGSFPTPNLSALSNSDDVETSTPVRGHLRLVVSE